jgi:predicted transcriptional regulator
MSNTITIELCAEDRARLDRLAEALERRTCDKCVTTAMAYVKATNEPKPETDPVQQALAETLAKAESSVEPPKNATEEAKDSTLTTPSEEEKPTAEEPTTPPTTKTVDRTELRAKVIELSAKGLKEQVKEIVRAYAQTVTDVPEDKVTECYMRLVGLEN